MREWAILSSDEKYSHLSSVLLALSIYLYLYSSISLSLSPSYSDPDAHSCWHALRKACSYRDVPALHACINTDACLYSGELDDQWQQRQLRSFLGHCIWSSRQQVCVACCMCLSIYTYCLLVDSCLCYHTETLYCMCLSITCNIVSIYTYLDTCNIHMQYSVYVI
jgi:hypothetical protein